MKRSFLIGLACIGATMLAMSSSPVPAQPATAPSTASADDALDYRPPSRGTPNARIGGGSRSGVKVPTVVALVPNHLALTTTSRPVLWWYCSEATDLPRDFAVVDALSKDTLKQRFRMSGPIEAGWQKIDLSALGLDLAADTPYEWRISLIVSETNRSDNAVAGGMIQVAKLEPSVDPATAPLKRAGMYAQAGFWHDALTLVMQQLSQPDGPEARARLASLLTQVGLDEAAAYAAR